MAMGRVRMTTRALGRWKRKIRQTTLTAMASLMISSFSVAMEPLDQIRPVIGGDDLHAFGQTGRDIFFYLLLDPFDDIKDIFPEADNNDAAGHLTLAVQIGKPRRISGPSWTRATSFR